MVFELIFLNAEQNQSKIELVGLGDPTNEMEDTLISKNHRNKSIKIISDWQEDWQESIRNIVWS